MLAGLRIVRFPIGVKILLDKLEMTTTTDGVHIPLDAQTIQELRERIE
ncbi:MAG: hypothetical protein LBD75_03080 [Candidatus Peribacteria bacterium]|jgi:hypothetical protein|nr:hypothetical protein [Candidatus Peribacteria bacterium]